MLDVWLDKCNCDILAFSEHWLHPLESHYMFHVYLQLTVSIVGSHHLLLLMQGVQFLLSTIQTIKFWILKDFVSFVFEVTEFIIAAVIEPLILKYFVLSIGNLFLYF